MFWSIDGELDFGPLHGRKCLCVAILGPGGSLGFASSFQMHFLFLLIIPYVLPSDVTRVAWSRHMSLFHHLIQNVKMATKWRLIDLRMRKSNCVWTCNAGMNGFATKWSLAEMKKQRWFAKCFACAFWIWRVKHVLRHVKRGHWVLNGNVERTWYQSCNACKTINS